MRARHNRGAMLVCGVVLLAGCGTAQAHSATEQAASQRPATPTPTTTIDPATITLPPMARLPIAAPVGCVAWTVDGRFSPGAYQPGAVYVGPMFETGDYYLSVEECAARGVTTPPHFPIESSSPLQITDRPEHMPDFTTTNCVVWSDGVRPALIPGSRYVYVRPGQDFQIDADTCNSQASLIPPCTAPTFDQCLEAGAATNR